MYKLKLIFNEANTISDQPVLEYRQPSVFVVTPSVGRLPEKELYLPFPTWVLRFYTGWFGVMGHIINLNKNWENHASGMNRNEGNILQGFIIRYSIVKSYNF